MTSNVKEKLKNIGYFFLFCVFVYCFYCAMSITAYNRDKNFINNEENFKKIKIKVDSVYIYYLHGSDRNSTDEYYDFFSKKKFLFEMEKNYDKPIFSPNRKFEVDEVNQYRKEHQDTIYVWYLDDNFIQYARENEKVINLSKRIENVNSIKIKFTICIILVLIILSVFFIKNKFK